MGTLGQLIQDDPNSIKALCRSQKFCDEVHCDLLLFLHGNLQRLQLAMRPLMLDLDHPIGQALLDVPDDLPFHTWPPVTLS